MKTLRDVNQIHQYEHNEEDNARRVFVVNPQKMEVEVDPSKITKAIENAFKSASFNVDGGKEQVIVVPEIVQVEKQVIIPQVETKIIEVPVIQKETEVITIEKPIITEISRVIEIEKPVIIEKIIEKIPAWCWSLIFSQTLAIAALVWLLKKGA